MALLAFRPDRFLGGPGVARGMVLMLVATFSGAAMNGVIRYLAAEMHPFEIAFFRCLFGLLALAPLLARAGLVPWKTSRPGLHLLRGGLQAVGMVLGFMALALTPLAKVAALQFTVPLFVTVLALIILHEVIRLRRVTALIVGFLGALIIVRPTGDVPDAGSMLVLASASFSALSTIVVKMLSRTEGSTTIVLYATAIMTPLTLLVALSVWITPSVTQLLWLALLGAMGTVSNVSFAQALKEAEVTAVMPLEFAKLPWSALIGYLAFAEVPEMGTWVGAIVIFTATTYIIFRERQLRRRASKTGI